MWQLATVYGAVPLSTNFCHVFWISVLTTIVTILACFVSGWFLGDLVASAIVSFQYGELVGMFAAAVILVCLWVGLYAVLFVLTLLGAGADKTAEVLRPKPGGFIDTTYRSWKDKYCPTVTEVE